MNENIENAENINETPLAELPLADSSDILGIIPEESNRPTEYPPIIDFTYRARVDKRQALPWFMAVLAIAIVLVVASIISPLYKGLISTAAVVAIVAAVTVFTRYMISDYAYAVITGSDGCAYFLITKLVGKRVETVFQVGLSSFVSITSIDPKAQITADTGYALCKVYPNMKPDKLHMIKINDRRNKLLIKVEITDEVASRLMEYAKIAKATEPEE